MSFYKVLVHIKFIWNICLYFLPSTFMISLFLNIKFLTYLEIWVRDQFLKTNGFQSFECTTEYSMLFQLIWNATLDINYILTCLDSVSGLSILFDFDTNTLHHLNTCSFKIRLNISMSMPLLSTVSFRHCPTFILLNISKKQTYSLLIK